MSALSKDVYDLLNMYGNTVISLRAYHECGESALLKELANAGYRCVINVYKHEKPGDSTGMEYRDKDYAVLCPSVIITWLDFGNRPGRK